MISTVAVDNQIENSKAFSFSASGKLAGDYAIQLIGHFNQENAVAAGLARLRLELVLRISKGIAATRVPGRMEVLLRKMEPRSSSTTPTMGIV